MKEQECCERCGCELGEDLEGDVFNGDVGDGVVRTYCDEECFFEDMDDYRLGGDEIDEDYLIDGVGFADPGGNSALRVETKDNPRNLPCPTCGAENVLTPLDVVAGYQCDRCADQLERGY